MALLHPESDLSMSDVAFGASILRILMHKKKSIIADELMESFLRVDKRRTPGNFFSAVYFLYMVGAIDKTDYHIKINTSFSNDPIQSEFQF